MVAFLEMHCINMHLHVRPLTKASVAEVTLPFLLAAMRRRDVPLERVAAVERVGTLLAVVVTPGRVFRRHVHLEVVAPRELRVAKRACQAFVGRRRRRGRWW